MDFETLGLNPRLINALKEQGITEPTPIQTKAIPLALEGRDVMGLAQTGTGKTAAFGLPMIHALWKVGKKPAPKTVRGLILAPTRELANQIKDNLWQYTQGSLQGGPCRWWCVDQCPNQTLGTRHRSFGSDAGRLIDLIDRAAVDLSQSQYLVLDERTRCLTLVLSMPCAASHRF